MGCSAQAGRIIPMSFGATIWPISRHLRLVRLLVVGSRCRVRVHCVRLCFNEAGVVFPALREKFADVAVAISSWSLEIDLCHDSDRQIRTILFEASGVTKRAQRI